MAKLFQLWGIERTIRDDLGAEHVIPAKEWAKGDHPSPRIAFVLREASAIAVGKVENRAKQFMILFACIIVISVVAILLVTAGVVGPGVSRFSGPMGCAVGIVGGALVRRAYFRKHADRLVAMMTRNGLCAACGYETVGAVPDETGMLRCAECGAAWRADRFPKGSVAGEGEPMRGDPVARGLMTMFRGQRRSRTGSDHRGNAVALGTRSPREAARSTDAPDLARRRASAEREARLASRSDRWTYSILFAAFGCALALGFIWVGLRANSVGAMAAPVAIGVFFFASLCATVWQIWSGRGLAPAYGIDEILLAHGLCPGCADDLDGVAEDADGCVVCPTCASAWRVVPGIVCEATGDDPGEALVSADDTGAPVVVNADSWSRARGSAAEPLARVVRSARKRTRRSPVVLVRSAGFGIALVLPVAGIAAMLGAAADRAFEIAACAGALVFLLSVGLRTMPKPPVAGQFFALRAKRAGLCPACGRVLAGLAVPEDGLVVCPGCSATWRFDAESGRAAGIGADESGTPSPGREDAATLSISGERGQKPADD